MTPIYNPYFYFAVAAMLICVSCNSDHKPSVATDHEKRELAAVEEGSGSPAQKNVDYTLYEHDTRFQPMLGKAAPDFSLRDVNGKQFSLQQFRGKHIVIHFAASWCPFCTEEGPHLEEVFQKFKNKGVQVLLIDVMEPRHVAAKIQEIHNFSFPVLVDQKGTVAKRYAPEGVMLELAREEVPIASNLIIDDTGVIRYYTLLDTENFDAELVQLQDKLNELLELN